MKIGVLVPYSRAWFVKNANFLGFHEFFNNLSSDAISSTPPAPQ